MNQRMIGWVLVAVGVVLLVFGYNASQSLGSQLKLGFTGSLTDKAMLYYMGGAISVAIGAFLALMKGR
jgi:uncharacterized membrane protein YidH (DUF202 family)